MNYPNRGYALVINNINFINPELPTRRGADCDTESVVRCLRRLEFDIDIQLNQTRDQMKTLLENYSKLDHSLSDCFLCVIMSHGNDNYVQGIDGTEVANDGMHIQEEAVAHFANNKCPSLKNKPKLFFLDFCRNVLKKTQDVNPLVKETLHNSCSQTASCSDINDFHFSFSTLLKFSSFRNPQRGNWYIQELTSVMEEFCHSRTLNQMILVIKRRLSEKAKINMAQTGVIECMLRYEIAFKPKRKRVLRGHTGHVLSLELLENNRLASGSTNGSIFIWRLASEECVHRLLGAHKQGVTTIVSLKNDEFASGSYDATFCIWNSRTGECKRRFESFRPDYPILAMHLLANGQLLCLARPKLICFIDVTNRTMVRNSEVNYISRGIMWKQFPMKSELQGIQKIEHTLRIWDLDQKDHNDGVSAIKRFLASLNDPSRQPIQNHPLEENGDGVVTRNIQTWQADSKKHKPHNQRIVWLHIQKSTSNSNLVESTRDTSESPNITILYVKPCVQTLAGHTQVVSSLEILENGTLFASASHDHTIIIWNKIIDTEWKKNRVLEGHTDKVTTLQALGNKRLASGSDDCTIRVWNFETGQSLQVVQTPLAIVDLKLLANSKFFV